MSVLGGSDSFAEFKQFQQQQTTGDYGLAIRTKYLGPVRSNNVAVSVGRGANYTVNNITQAGYTEEDVESALEGQRRGLALALTGIEPAEDNTGLDVLVNDRLAENLAAPETQRKTDFNIAALIGVVIVLGILAVVFGRKGKNSHA